MIIQQHSFQRHAVDEDGMPNLAFELFYQQGMMCYRWALPRLYVIQALRAIYDRYTKRFGVVEYWQFRAFAYGLCGLDGSGLRSRCVPADFSWPLPPDPSWMTVICLYPDGKCDLDFAHPISRRFWSEDNGHLELPCYESGKLGGWWFGIASENGK